MSTGATAAMEACAVSANSSRIAALGALVLTAATLVHPGYAEDLSRQPTLPSPHDCNVVYMGATNNQGNLVQVDSQASIDCARVGNTAPYGAGAAYTAGAAVPDGRPCQVLYYAPVKFQNFPTFI